MFDRVRDIYSMYSPALEAVLSLHVLFQPRHHPHQHEWVRAARRKLTAVIKKELSGYRLGHATGLPALLMPPSDSPPSAPDFDGELDRLRSHASDLGRQLVRCLTANAPVDWDNLSNPAVQAAMLNEAAGLGPDTFQLIHLGLSQPRELGQHFLDVLHRYWHVTGFERQWIAAERVLNTEVNRLCDSTPQDLARVCGQLLQAQAVSPDNHEVLLLLPSTFIWPHTWVVQDPGGGRTGLLYSAPASPEPSWSAVPDDLLPSLRALADGTRLNALRLIAGRPRSTQELAPLLGVSEAATSKHLRQLAEAGLVQCRRDGYYVLYQLTPAAMERVTSGLTSFLRRPPSLPPERTCPKV